MYLHTDKDGNKTKLCDLGLNHLKNIIKLIERKAEEGLTLRYGYCGSLADDFWYDEDIIYGKEVYTKLHYRDYMQELARRNA